MDDFKKKNRRGNALPEVVLVMGLLFLLLFGAVNMAFLAYNQMQADGATYVAARAAAAYPSAPASAAATAVGNVFPRVASGAISVEQIGNLVQATYQGTSPGLLLLNEQGTGAFNVFSREVETTFNPSTSSLGTAVGSQYPYTVGSSGLVKLNNYANSAGTLSTYYIWPAQSLKIVSSGCTDAGNGAGSSTTDCYSAAEFAGHCEEYTKFKFTAIDSKTPTVASTNNAREKEYNSDQKNWNPTNTSSPNYKIYGWDASPHTPPSPGYGSKATQSSQGAMQC